MDQILNRILQINKIKKKYLCMNDGSKGGIFPPGPGYGNGNGYGGIAIPPLPEPCI